MYCEGGQQLVSVLLTAPDIVTAGPIVHINDTQLRSTTGAGDLRMTSGRLPEEGSSIFIGSHLMLYRAHLSHCTQDLPGSIGTAALVFCREVNCAASVRVYIACLVSHCAQPGHRIGPQGLSP